MVVLEGLELANCVSYSTVDARWEMIVILREPSARTEHVYPFVYKLPRLHARMRHLKEFVRPFLAKDDDGGTSN